ncbi:MAG: site-specific integrase [Longimicrobiales bacterium]
MPEIPIDSYRVGTRWVPTRFCESVIRMGSGMQTKLTKRMLDRLAPDVERQLIFDTELPGFGVRAMRSGVRTFFAQYRTAGGRRGRKRRVTIGRYGPLTVEQARAAAKALLGDVAQGGDPATSRAASKTAPTLRELGETFLANVEAKRKKSTAKEYRRLWERHVLPELGTTLVASVSTAQVSGLHRRMRKTPYLANRMLSLVGGFFSFAEHQGARPRQTNPVKGIEPYKERSRERFLTPAETRRLGEALVQAETVGLPPAPGHRRKPATGATAKHRPKSAGTPKVANLFAVAAIRFLLLTGFREKEALGLRWDTVNLERKVAVLPDTKTGKSVRRLGAAAVLLLDSLPRVKRSPYVFPGSKPGKPLVEINRVWYAVRHAAGLDDVRLHDLRHSFASAVASAGGSLLMIRNLLGHKDTTTTAKYAHLLEDPVQATADATAGELADLLGSSSGKKSVLVRAG